MSAFVYPHTATPRLAQAYVNGHADGVKLMIPEGRDDWADIEVESEDGFDPDYWDGSEVLFPHQAEVRPWLDALNAAADGYLKDQRQRPALTREQGQYLVELFRNATETAERTGNLFADYVSRSGGQQDYLTARTESDAALEAAAAAVWELTR